MLLIQIVKAVIHPVDHHVHPRKITSTVYAKELVHSYLDILE